MRKTSKKSAFSQQRSEVNIIDIAAEKAIRRYRIEFDQLTRTLELVVPNDTSPSGEQSFDITELISFPGLWQPFSDAMLQKTKDSRYSISTISSKCDSLKKFFEYLKLINAYSYTLDQITTTVIEGYIIWLDRPNQDGTVVYSANSKIGIVSTLRLLIASLQASDKWSKLIAQDVHVRTRIWFRGQTNKSLASTLSDSDYGAIYKACENEIIITMERVQHLRSLMQANLLNPVALLPDLPRNEKLYHESSKRPIRAVWANNPYKDLGILLATMHYRVPDIVIRDSIISNFQDEFLSYAARSTRVHGGVSAYEQCFYPSPRDLIPFALMMAIHLDYNPDTLLKSKVSDYRISKNQYDRKEFVAPNLSGNSATFLDSDTVRIDDFKAFAKKGRSKNKRQEQIRPATNDPDNPAAIWKFLIEWTKFLRPHLQAGFRERLFVFVPAAKKRNPRGFKSVNGNCSTDGAWVENLMKFYKENNLKYYPLQKFRIKGLDISDVLFKGDIRAKQAAGNHVHPDITYRHYTTIAQRQRGDEYLAQISHGRQRWRETKGKIDIRNMPDGADLGAATPGWTCLDPFSPPNGPTGKLCMKFGECPNCPHGSIDPNDAYCCAQAWNLLAAIDNASTTLPPESWMMRWNPVKEKLLKHWLPRFSTCVKDEAKLIRLMPLPNLE